MSMDVSSREPQLDNRPIGQSVFNVFCTKVISDDGMTSWREVHKYYSNAGCFFKVYGEPCRHAG